MKTNEAPEKLYVNFHFMETHPESHQPLVTKQGINKYDIEYTRTDAFIEKAEEFIYSALNDGTMGTANIEDFMRLFKKYMKGE